MSEIAGLWEDELERIVQKLAKGGAAKVENHEHKRIMVKVEPIDEWRCGPNEAYA